MDPRPDYGESSYRGLGRLKDKVALVTGADSGIGRAVALAFAREGADVVIAYLSEHEDANVTRLAVESAGRRALLAPGDLDSDGACKALAEKAAREFGRIDILVNNAAYQGKSVKKFEELDAERVEKTFRVNILAIDFKGRQSAAAAPIDMQLRRGVIGAKAHLAAPSDAQVLRVPAAPTVAGAEN